MRDVILHLKKTHGFPIMGFPTSFGVSNIQDFCLSLQMFWTSSVVFLNCPLIFKRWRFFSPLTVWRCMEVSLLSVCDIDLMNDIRSLPNTFFQHAVHLWTCHARWKLLRILMDSFDLIKPKKSGSFFWAFWRVCTFFCCFFCFFHETTKSEKHNISSHHWKTVPVSLIGLPVVSPGGCQLPWKTTSHLKNAMASLVSDFLVKRRDEVCIWKIASYSWYCYIISVICCWYLLPNSGIKTLVVVCTSAGMSMHMLITGGCGSLIFFFKTFRLSKVYPKTKSTKRNTEPTKY